MGWQFGLGKYITLSHKGSCTHHSITSKCELRLQGVSELFMARDLSKDSQLGIGRILDPDWADLDMLKKWIHDCSTRHGKSCDNPLKTWKVRPAWLIDVRNKCLVPGHVSGNFVALSYTYGNHKASRIDAHILARLQKPQALEAPEIGYLIVSPIVRRAIYLTSVVGEPYLWADSLCIPHHDATATTRQLVMMGAIYANAVMTIIAADGDSTNGLEGIRGVSPSRRLNQGIVPFGEAQLVPRTSGFFQKPYYRRGWTYQEFELSARRIIFNGKQLHWKCSCSEWEEQLVRGAEFDRNGRNGPRDTILQKGFPDPVALSSIIQKYNERELRHEEDALPGISGLLSVLSRSFPGGFLCGTPIMFFDRFLGWCPKEPTGRLRRRVASDRSPEDQLKPSGLPSWSWVGWRGSISLAADRREPIQVYPTNHHQYETTPITEWYTGPSADTLPSKRRRIRSTWYENRDRYKDVNEPLPSGWTRHPTPDERWPDIIFPDGCGQYIYTHDKIPWAWYYPFPIADIHESMLPSMPEQTEYLFCDTARCWLWARREPGSNLIALSNKDGKKIGSLHLHNGDLLARFPEAGSRYEKGLKVELVAIYKSRSYSHIFWEPLKSPIRDLYVVLWIEWRDGVAYRLASGEVEADEWEALRPQRVSLVLG